MVGSAGTGSSVYVPTVLAAEVFARGAAADRIGDAVAVGREYLTEVLSDADYVAQQVADAWSDVDREAEFAEFVTTWRDRFAETI